MSPRTSTKSKRLLLNYEIDASVVLSASAILTLLLGKSSTSFISIHSKIILKGALDLVLKIYILSGVIYTIYKFAFDCSSYIKGKFIPLNNRFEQEECFVCKDIFSRILLSQSLKPEIAAYNTCSRSDSCRLKRRMLKLPNPLAN